MAETDDPWADHVRGTPIAEGSDPLSNGLLGDAAGKDSAVKAPQEVLAKSKGRMDDILGETPFMQGEQDGTSSLSVESRVNGYDAEPAPSSDTVVPERAEEEDSEDEDDDDEPFVYPGANVAADAETTATIPPVEISVDETREDEAVISQPTSAADEPSNSNEVTHATEDGRDTPIAEAQPIDYLRLSQLCSQGLLTALQSFFAVTTSPAPAGSGVSAFALANEPSPTSGLVPIQYAAREGRVDVLKWLIREAGALVEMEDREGETALHKAAMAGKLPALTFLIASGASANSVDGDGWTPLHNACSRGYLDIVKVLIENAGASVDVKGGRGAWTPLMNAASNGHLPIVRYLTTKQHIDPFIRNSAGETAYDVAAATFEVFICEILERYESERWAAFKFSASAGDAASQPHGVLLGHGPYNPLALHSTVPIILHENQRLDTRLSTLAIRGGKPRWSGTQAGRPDKHDRRAPGTMPPGPLSLSRTRNLPMARDDIKLPTQAQPYKLQLPNRSAQIAAAKRARGEVVGNEEDLSSTPTPDSVLQNGRRSSAAGGAGSAASGDAQEPSHFWLSDWQNDYTHPQVDAEQGWQYSQAFDTPDERWLASTPAPLVRLLEGRGLGASVQRAVSSAVLASTGAAPVMEAEAVSSGWVRRRRWVRVMRRRLDISLGDALEAAEQASLDALTSQSSALDGTQPNSVLRQAQADARQAAQRLGSDATYIDRSRAMAGSLVGSTPADMSEEEMQGRIARLELAVGELRQYAFSDDDVDRQQHAEELLKEFTVQLGQLRQAVGLDAESEEDDEEDEDSDEEFIYPNSYKDDGQSVITRIGGPLTTSSGVVPSRPSVTQRQSSTPSVFGERAAPSEAGTSLGAIRSADLANAREFRVPTHEVPSRPTHHGMTGAATGGSAPGGLREHSMLPVWESDADASTCRGCNRKFTFFLRKHHCRRCGRIFCDPCSSHRAHLSPDELIIDPGVPEMLLEAAHGPARICDSCDAERRLPVSLRGARGIDVVSGAIDRMDVQSNGGGGDDVSDVSSHASELTDCPVCGRALAAFGEQAAEQEEHVRTCLENGGGGSVQGGRYLVYKLGEGPIVGKECQICLEDLLVGMTVARLPCLCYYHRHCIDAWFNRGRCCPVHARSW